MKTAASALLPLLLVLPACQQGAAVDNGTDAEGGRYAGIGTYASDSLWAHVQGAPPPGTPEAARLKDDSQIIVVVDRQTGEVRQCGNRSGFCTAMNPWKGAAPSLPARLDRHADDEAGATNAAENAS